MVQLHLSLCENQCKNMNHQRVRWSLPKTVCNQQTIDPNRQDPESYRDQAGEKPESLSFTINHYCSAPSQHHIRDFYPDCNVGISADLEVRTQLWHRREISMVLKGTHYVTLFAPFLKPAPLSLIFPSILFFPTIPYSGQYCINPKEGYNSQNHRILERKEAKRSFHLTASYTEVMRPFVSSTEWKIRGQNHGFILIRCTSHHILQTNSTRGLTWWSESFKVIDLLITPLSKKSYDLL